ncbi:hypothetical protein HT031_001105 [Scenedesmus sp. PABB004]|nr:hypothetical protein HT031_001105 [Scenedesmus sp. PABB004]
MSSAATLAVLGLIVVAGAADAAAAAAHRKLASFGADDVAAFAAVGQAGVTAGMGASYVSKEVAYAHAKEARAAYKAHKRVAAEVEEALHHAEKYADNPVKAAKAAKRDAEDIADAVAEAKEIKVKAKLRSMKIVAKSLAKAVPDGLAAGGAAALAVSSAALRDASAFPPLLAGIAPAVLPPLAAGFGAGPAGAAAALGGLARAVSSAVAGRFGLDGPGLLAGRVADLLPPSLLAGVGDADVVNAVAGFLAGGASPLSLPNPSRFPNPSAPPALGPKDLFMLPVEAAKTLLAGLVGQMKAGGAPFNDRGLNLPDLPPAGVPLPLGDLGSLLGVLPRPDLLSVFRQLPEGPLAGLLAALPLGLEA